MNLYETKTRYTNGNIQNIPLSIYVIAEDTEDAIEKTNKAIGDSPDEWDNWHLDTDPILLASNECGEDVGLLAQNAFL